MGLTSYPQATGGLSSLALAFGGRTTTIAGAVPATINLQGGSVDEFPATVKLTQATTVTVTGGAANNILGLETTAATSVDMSAVTTLFGVVANIGAAAFTPPNAGVSFFELTASSITSLTLANGLNGWLDLVTPNLVTLNIGTVTSNFYYLDCAGAKLNVASVDAILAELDAHALQAGDVNTIVDLSGGTNASPTDGALNANVLSLIGKGWTVNIN